MHSENGTRLYLELPPFCDTFIGSVWKCVSPVKTAHYRKTIAACYYTYISHLRLWIIYVLCNIIQENSCISKTLLKCLSFAWPNIND